MKILKNAAAAALCGLILSGNAFSAFADSGNGEGDRINFKDKKEISLGDVDTDGKITTDDALLQLKKVVALEELHGVASCAADIDGDGKITTDDALEVLKNVVGLTNDLGKGTLLQTDLVAKERGKDLVIPYAEIKDYKTLTVIVDLNESDKLGELCNDNGAIGFDNTENDNQWATPLAYQWSYKDLLDKYKGVSFHIDIDLSTVVEDKEIFVQYWWKDEESNGITYTFFAR